MYLQWSYRTGLCITFFIKKGGKCDSRDIDETYLEHWHQNCLPRRLIWNKQHWYVGGRRRTAALKLKAESYFLHPLVQPSASVRPPRHEPARACSIIQEARSAIHALNEDQTITITTIPHVRTWRTSVSMMPARQGSLAHHCRWASNRRTHRI